MLVEGEGVEVEGVAEAGEAAAVGAAWRGRLALSRSSCWLQGTCAACNNPIY